MEKLLQLSLRVFRWMAFAFSIIAASPTAYAGSTLVAFMNSDLKIVDPIWTNALITRSHGYMVYDTLFAMDAAGEIKPQMVDHYSISADGLTYSFVLRDGLLWHDGMPVTAEDCIASLRRWGAVDSVGKKLLGSVEAFAVTDDHTFTMTLKQPVGFVLAALGKPLGIVPFMMPKRIAMTDPTRQITETIGSGPFVFKKDEWRPGQQEIYVKFEGYKPRSEPASGFAGGKVVKLDRVEWRVMTDAQQVANALLTGEVDYVETPIHDLLPLLARNPNVSLVTRSWIGNQLFFRPNWLQKPFDNPKIRAALWHALNQEDFLQATVGDPKYFQVCKSFFPCGTPLSTVSGMETLLGANSEKARELLNAAGYDGTPIVILQPTDVYIFENLANVAKDLLERAGFKVEVQSLDMQTLFSRRTRKEAPEKGGWNAYLLSVPAPDLLDPMVSANLDASCEKAQAGWPCDAKLEELRDRFASATDLAERKALAEAVQRRAIETTPYIPLGQWYGVTAMRKAVTGMPNALATVFWSLEKH